MKRAWRKSLNAWSAHRPLMHHPGHGPCIAFSLFLHNLHQSVVVHNAKLICPSPIQRSCSVHAQSLHNVCRIFDLFTNNASIHYGSILGIAYAGICHHMPAYGNICWHMASHTWAHASICKHMLAYASHMVAYPSICKHMPSYVSIC